MNIEQIRQHIDQLIKEKGKNYRSLSLAVGKNEAYLHQYINKGSPLRLPESERRKLAELLDVDEQELTDIKLPKTMPSNNKNPNTCIINILDSSGSDDIVFEQGFWALPASSYLNLTGLSPEDVKIFPVLDDSMSPTAENGDFVLINTKIQTFLSDGLYLINNQNTVNLRRLQRVSQNELLVISDNVHYKNISVAPKKTTIIGKAFLLYKAQKI